MSIRILFLNFDLGYDSGQQTLVGASNKFYGGPSRWNLEHCCQAIETQFANERDYLFALRDLAQKWSLYGQKWIPVPSIERMTDEELLAECKRRGFTDVLPLPPPETVAIGGWAPLPYNTPFLRIKKLAADNDVDIADCKTNVERINTINTALVEKLKASATV